MRGLRVSHAARKDLASILTTSLELWGERGRDRYASLLAAAMRWAAAEPHGPLTRARPELQPEIRSVHIRYLRRGHGVGAPVHVLYYRVTEVGSIEIIRVLHERMDPKRHMGTRKKVLR